MRDWKACAMCGADILVCGFWGLSIPQSRTVSSCTRPKAAVRRLLDSCRMLRLWRGRHFVKPLAPRQGVAHRFHRAVTEHAGQKDPVAGGQISPGEDLVDSIKLGRERNADVTARSRRRQGDAGCRDQHEVVRIAEAGGG